MALTQKEKDILGAMVDQGQLRGEERVAVGADDTLAREKIVEFKEQQATILTMQLQSYTSSKENFEAEIIRLTALQTLLGE